MSRLDAIPEGAWILRGDRGLTFARDLPRATTWWRAAGGRPTIAGPPLVWLDIDAARALNLKIGDTITIAVLGSPDRSADRLLPDDRLAQPRLQLRDHLRARHARTGALHADGDRLARRGPSTPAFERALAADLPMVSVIRVCDVMAQVTTILEALDNAITLATLIAILIGVAVLAGAVAATRAARARESVLLNWSAPPAGRSSPRS